MSTGARYQVGERVQTKYGEGTIVALHHALRIIRLDCGDEVALGTRLLRPVGATVDWVAVDDNLRDARGRLPGQR